MGHKAHGLEGLQTEPDWPPLTLAEVDRLLREYPQATGALRLLSHSPRPFSSASLVQTPHGKVMVKRHARSVRDREGLLEEHRLLEFLSDRTRLVQAAYRRADGESAIEQADWTYEVHPAATGLDLYEEWHSWTPFLSEDHARSAGRALAQLHKAAESYEVPSRKTQQLVTSFTIFAYSTGGNSPVAQMERYLSYRPLLREYAEQRDWRRSFEQLLMPLFQNLQPWLKYLRPLWTHNDFHASNLMWSGEGVDAEVTGIIDFGLADRTNAVHDLATVIERNVVEWLQMDDPRTEIVHLDHLDELLVGYEELFPLSYEQARALVAMLPLVHCEFALSETDYFLSVLHSEERACLAYEGYFLAHSEWFRGVQGQRLLEHLRKWADRHAAEATQ